MLIDMYGNINYGIKGVATTKNNVMLTDNQFLQWSKTGKRLELWEGKKQYLEDRDTDCVTRRVTYWNQNSVLAIFS